MKKTILAILAIFTISSADAQLITSTVYDAYQEESSKPVQNSKSTNIPRYRGELQAGFFASPYAIGPTIRTTHGVLFTDWLFVGLGFGLEQTEDEALQLIVPIYGDFRFYIPKQKVKPYLDFSIGSDAYDDLGLSTSLAIGFETRHFSMDVGFYYQDNAIVRSYSYNYDYYGYYGDSRYSRTEHYTANEECYAFLLRIGCVF